MSDWLDVSAITPRIAYTATAGQTAFVVPFVFFADEDLLVYQNTTLLTLATHYTVSGAESPTGGTVALVTGATLGDEVMIAREVAIVQTTHIPPSGPLDIPAVNFQISKLIAIDQQLKDRIERSIHLSDSDSTLSTELESVANRKNRLLGFDTDGSLIYPLGPDFVSTTSTGVAEVDSRATAQVTTFDPSVTVVVTYGLTVPGDGGGGTYKLGTVSSPGVFQDAGGQYWELFGSTTGGGLTTPGGRLTLTSGIPVMGTSVAAATTVFYTAYAGNEVPIYDGANMTATAFAELSQDTTDTTKSPAAVATNSLYDIFVWNDAGTMRATRGPAWTNATTRSAGTALVLVKGIYLNSVAITNGPAAQRGTYVGTIASNGTSTIDYIFGSIGSGGVAANFGVWNAYNRVTVGTTVRDNTNQWNYAVNGVWRAANASATFRVTAVRGLDEDAIQASYDAVAQAGAAATAVAGVGLDTTTSYNGTTGFTILTTLGSFTSRYSGLMGLGQHYISGNEYNDTATASTWRGLVTSFPIQSGLHVVLRQ